MQNTVFRSASDAEKTRAVLVSAVLDGEDRHESEISLSELERLLETAGGECAAKLVQYKENPDPRSYIGSGKLTELRELCKNTESTLAVFDAELTPSQIRNIEKELNTDKKDKEEEADKDEEKTPSDEGYVLVIDRSMLILDIFALHAKSGEGKLQVELALLKYTTPRLTGKGLQLSRQGGGIGTRGPGESKLESDRRHVKRRMDALENELKNLERTRETQRKARDRAGIYKIAVAGYTNAGKSTLLNYLTGAGILAEDKLFATLDTTTRLYSLPDGSEVLLTDTVGFIRNLPHHLIKAFKSTLDEVRYSDAVLVLIDASESECHLQLEVTEGLLEELGAGNKPVLYVYNKCDLEAEVAPIVKQDAGEDNVFFISAKTGEGVDKLIERIQKLVGEGKATKTYLFRHADMGRAGMLFDRAVIVEKEYVPEGLKIKAVVDKRTAGALRDVETKEESDG